jgi:dienelactone hydrolase
MIDLRWRTRRLRKQLRLLVLVSVTAFAAGTVHGQTPVVPEQVSFQSATYVDPRQLLSREAPAATVTVPANLSFPDEVRDRYPAVVVVHTLGGYNEANEGQYAAELRRAGFATLTYDSFAARGATGLALSRSGPGLWPSGVADAYAALRLLASDPRIDAGRIAVAGFSYGGEVAHLASLEIFRAVLNPGEARFAAHVAYYPAGVFGAVAGPGAYTGSPILLLLGGKDDNLPVAKIESYLAYAKAAGSPLPIETVTYPNAYHAWTVPSMRTLRFYGEYASTKQCPLILLGAGRPARLVDGQSTAFDPSGHGACMAKAPGYSMIFDEAVRAQSATESIGFLRRHLLRP